MWCILSRNHEGNRSGWESTCQRGFQEDSARMPLPPRRVAQGTGVLPDITIELGGKTMKKLLAVLALTFLVAGCCCVCPKGKASKCCKQQSVCCAQEKGCCQKADCCKDGADCCKAGADCCKDGAECCKDGAECCKDGADCCKDGADCCKAGAECCKDYACCK